MLMSKKSTFLEHKVISSANVKLRVGQQTAAQSSVPIHLVLGVRG